MRHGAGNLDPPVQSSNRPAVAYNNAQMIAAPLSVAGGNSALKSEMQPPRLLTPRILAVDYGRKRIGLALSDELGITAQPLQTLVRKNRREDLRRLREICRTHGVARILVGHPVHITGEAGEMADEASRFAVRLHKELGMDVELADERLTSWEAEQTMAETGSAGRRKNLSLDAIAAAILLREYLESRRSTAAGKE
jgi:putative holliday junction resolvase